MPKGFKGFQKGNIPWNKGIKCPDFGKRQLGNKNHNWKGGKWQDKNGYVYVHKPNHPNHNIYNYVYEHRLVMEKFLGRYLTKIEIVHHKNEITNDNRIKNLKLFSNNGEHRKHHHLLKSKKSILKRIIRFILNFSGLKK